MVSTRQVLFATVLLVGIIPDSFSQKLELISKAMDGKAAGGSDGNFYYTHGLSITQDGRYIVFSSLSPNIVQGDTNKFIGI